MSEDWAEKFLKDWGRKVFEGLGKKVFEGLGQKSFSYITYIHIHRFFKLLYRNSFSVDTFKKGCILYVYMYVELSFFSPISISKSELERHL